MTPWLFGLTKPQVPLLDMSVEYKENVIQQKPET